MKIKGWSLNFIYAVATLIGVIVGAGIFGLPFVSLKSGFFVTAFYLVILSVMMFFVHVFFGEGGELGRVGVADDGSGADGSDDFDGDFYLGHGLLLGLVTFEAHFIRWIISWVCLVFSWGCRPGRLA